MAESGLVGGVGTIGPACRVPSLPLTGIVQVGRKPKQVSWKQRRRRRVEEAIMEALSWGASPAVGLALSIELDLLAIADSPVSVIQAGFVKTNPHYIKTWESYSTSAALGPN